MTSKKSLEKIEGVQKVSVSRKWFRDIEIAITEWKTVAYLEDGGQYSLLLESGETFPTGMLLPEAESPVLNNFKNPETRKADNSTVAENGRQCLSFDFRNYCYRG